MEEEGWQEGGRMKNRKGWEVMIEFNALGSPYSLHRRQIAGPLGDDR